MSDLPDLGSIKIRLPDIAGGIEYPNFLSYDYNQHFLRPSDDWHFSLAGDELTDQDIRVALRPGNRVQVSVDGIVQTSGFLNKVSIRADRGSGTVVTIEGRDWLQRAVDSHVDPQTRLAASMSLADLVVAVFTPFGVKNFEIDNAANRNAIKGGIYGTKTTRKGKALKSYTLHQLKPYPQEGAFAFASRVSQRFGLWIWPAADGETLIVSKPDFDQDPSYRLQHKNDDSRKNNVVLDSEVEFNDEEQPSILFASGFGGGGEFAKSSLRGGIINPLIVTDNSAIVSKYPNVKFVIPPVAAIQSAVANVPYHNVNAVPQYLYDSEAHTQEQLNNYLLRELSLRMRKAFCARYTIEGHKLQGQAVTVDTIVDVDDDRSNVHTTLWILSRRFSKSAGQVGTKTAIEAILPGTLLF